ncbi:MAG TPA: GNAT family N-acetyltransferase [Propylenella sp.]|jgi:predicted GNAT family acetyltransferase
MTEGRDGGSMIEREDGPSGGVYRMQLDGQAAEMTFSRAGERLIIIDHTDMPAALRGRGVGESLVRHAVEEARRAGTKIFPLCPFAAAQFRKHPEFQDVLSK